MKCKNCKHEREEHDALLYKGMLHWVGNCHVADCTCNWFEKEKRNLK